MGVSVAQDLTVQLSQAGKFTVVERTQLEQVLKEKGLLEEAAGEIEILEVSETPSVGVLLKGMAKDGDNVKGKTQVEKPKVVVQKKKKSFFSSPVFIVVALGGIAAILGGGGGGGSTTTTTTTTTDIPAPPGPPE